MRTADEEQIWKISLYHSYWEAEQQMRNAKDRLSFLEAILAYAFDGAELPMTPGAAKAYILVKPVLETNRKKILAGRKAGAVQEKKT